MSDGLVVTNVRISREQWQALREEAVVRGAGGGRLDASAVLRDVLEDWLRGRKRPSKTGQRRRRP